MKNSTCSLLDNLSKDELADIAYRIKYLRNDILHMTQSQFALSVKISQTYLSQIENGNKKINMSTILLISAALKVNLDWLIYGMGTDDNIFGSEKVTKDSLIHSAQAAALQELQNSFSLKNNELDFLSWFLNLSSKDRQRYIDAVNILSSIPH